PRGRPAVRALEEAHRVPRRDRHGAMARARAGHASRRARAARRRSPRRRPVTAGRAWRGVIEEVPDRLPVPGAPPVVTLGEGGTPLVRSGDLSAATGCEVHLKFDGANPTGSFKDRGMTLAISKALEAGTRAVVCASTGNTSASAAAYAARAG